MGFIFWAKKFEVWRLKVEALSMAKLLFGWLFAWA
jgi:hypothetical protein